MITFTREEAQQVLDALKSAEEEMNCEYGVTEILRSKLNIPEREWQGLTEKETIDLALNAFALPEFSLGTRLRIHQELVSAMNEPDSRLMIFAATIEQALQEKNSA